MPIIIVLFLGLFLPTQLFAQTLTSANSHWPPWRTTENDGAMSGIEIDILKSLSAHLSLDLEIKSCGWKRCLKYLQVGEGDLMTGLLKNPERESYMSFIDPPYRTSNNTCFYQNKYQLTDINHYQDLYKITVGVVNKVAYFEPFDSDKKIKKHHAVTDENLFRLLKAGNIDTVIMNCNAGDAHLKVLGFTDEFKHANFVNRIEQPVYIAISKKSPFYPRKDEISKVLQSMLNKGEIKEIMNKYGIYNID